MQVVIATSVCATKQHSLAPAQTAGAVQVCTARKCRCLHTPIGRLLRFARNDISTPSWLFFLSHKRYKHARAIVRFFAHQRHEILEEVRNLCGIE